MLKPERNLKINQIVFLGFGLVSLSMIGIAIATSWATKTLVESSAWVAHTWSIKLQLNVLEKTLLNAETGQQGFLYTEQEKYLELYQQATQALEGSLLTELAREIGEMPEQQARLNQLDLLIEQKLAEFQKTINLAQAKKSQAAREVVVSNQGKILMDKIRAQLNEMIAAEEELLSQRIASAKRIEQIASVISWVGTAATVLFALIVASVIAGTLVKPLLKVVSTLATSSSEIAQTTQQHEKTATEQATAVNQVTTSLDELNASSRRSAEQAFTASDRAQKVLHLAQAGTQAVEQTRQEMLMLKEKVNAIAQQISQLNQQTTQIGTITSVVSDLANQTNMLALNAAVEAVRAGEYGKGFSVVATEIRKLSDQSQRSAAMINDLLEGIQQLIISTVKVSHQGSQTAEKGLVTVEKTTKTFEEVSQAVHEAVANSQAIALTSEQQAIAIAQLLEMMTLINRGATYTATGITQTKTETQHLSNAALTLQKML